MFIGEFVYLSGLYNGVDINFNVEDVFGYYNFVFLIKFMDYLNMVV